MRDFISKKVKELKPSGIRAFFDLASEMSDVISLGVGEPDFDTPWHVREEGIYSLEKGHTFYTSNAGLRDLRKEISNMVKRRYNLSYDEKSEILVTVGGSEAIDIALRALIEYKDEVLIPEPSYVAYTPCAILADAVPVIIKLEEKDNFKLTKEKLQKAITPKSKVLILPFPNNPTGAIMEKSDLEEIAKVIIDNDLFVISDEIYSEIVYGMKHVSIANIKGLKERSVVINGFSKSYAMTGWRLGYALGPSEIIAEMTKIHQFAIMCAPTTSQFAAIEALKNGDHDTEMMRESYNQRKRYLLDGLKKIGIPCFNPQGTFYLFPCIKKYGLSSQNFATKLLKDKRVVVVPGTAFGESGEGYIRISYASSLDNIKRALVLLKEFIDEISS